MRYGRMIKGIKYDSYRDKRQKETYVHNIHSVMFYKNAQICQRMDMKFIDSALENFPI